MKKEEWKHLRVKPDTHKRVKGLAGFKGTGIDEVVNFLLDELGKKSTLNVEEYIKI